MPQTTGSCAAGVGSRASEGVVAEVELHSRRSRIIDSFAMMVVYPANAECRSSWMVAKATSSLSSWSQARVDSCSGFVGGGTLVSVSMGTASPTSPESVIRA